MDPKFGMAAQTAKGKVFIFDDYHCYKQYKLESKTLFETVYVVCFDNPGNLIESQSSYFATGPEIHSPMGSATAFFADSSKFSVSFSNLSESGKFADLVNE